MSIVQLVYTSRNHQSQVGSSLLAELRDILRSSRKNNAAVGITGFLLMDAGCNVQILEGPALAIDRTFLRIQRDSRHREVRTLSRRELPSTLFPDWAMGASLRSLEGREIFLRHGVETVADLASAGAHTIVSLALDFSAASSERRLSAG